MPGKQLLQRLLANLCPQSVTRKADFCSVVVAVLHYRLQGALNFLNALGRISSSWLSSRQQRENGERDPDFEHGGHMQ